MLKGLDGKEIRLYSFAGKKGAVLFFLGKDCPVSNKYIPRMLELSRIYEPKGIVFLGINSNASESLQEVAAHAREHGVDFTVGKDPNNVVADLTQAERTSQVVVLDARATIRYQGAIDDQHVPGVSKPEAVHNYLADALDTLLARRPIEVASTPAVGCPIERVEVKASGVRVRPAAPMIVEAFKDQDKELTPAQFGQVTYAADVAPIIQVRCQACHRQGEVGPFPLMGYDDARKRSQGIAEVVADRRMPPWHADPRHGQFSNDRSLSSRERSTILAWVEQGSPLGDPAKLPAPRTFTNGWEIGTPDQIFTTPQPNQIPARGTLEYVEIAIPSNFDRDMWIQSAEIRPETRSVVHHIIVYVLPGNGRRAMPEHLAAYVPGDTPTLYPEGIAKKIPAGSRLFFQIHYTPDGVARTDQPRLGIVFVKTPVKHRAFTRFIENKRFEIAPNDPESEVKSSHAFSSDIHLLNLSPHMHLRGKDFKYTATFPDGKVEVLLNVPAYDFGWQSAYVLKEPRLIPKGTRIDCVAHFDNSSNNPANPDPNQTVKWGEQSSSEMMMGYFDYIDEAPADWKP